jgi:hypothetical protein
MVNSVLLNHPAGYAGTYNYDLLTSASNELLIVNSVFGQVGALYVNTTDVRAINNRYFEILDGAALFEGMVTANDIVALNGLPNCSGNAMTANEFADPTAGDFSLKVGSEWIDAGTQQGVLLPSFDYNGNPRIAGGAIDIGPIERVTNRSETRFWAGYK